MKKIVLAIGVLFLVGTGCVSNTAQPTKEVVAPTPLVQPVPVVVNEEKLPATAPTQEKMLTYKNKLYGFQFSYPASAKVRTNIAPNTKFSEYVDKVQVEFSNSSSSAYFEVYPKESKASVQRLFGDDEVDRGVGRRVAEVGARGDPRRRAVALHRQAAVAQDAACDVDIARDRAVVIDETIEDQRDRVQKIADVERAGHAGDAAVSGGLHRCLRRGPRGSDDVVAGGSAVGGLAKH